jgi:membrane associated rhomboid family serine protease
MSIVNEPLPAAENSAPPPVPAYIPWITYAVIAICGVICLYLNFATDMPSYHRVWSILIPSCIEIWGGAYWGLVTTAFVHLAFWHILFNMWWAKDFGRVLESTMGRGWYMLFIVGAAIVGSGAELAFSSQTGIGFSGVVYAMFGYGLVARTVEPRLQQIVNKQTVWWLLGWLVLCIFLTVAKVWQIANGAHLGGFLFGCLIASAFTVRRYVGASLMGLAVLFAMAVMSAVYAPWSPYWKDRGIISLYAAAPGKAKAGDREAQFLYSQLLMQEKGKQDEATSWLRKSAEQGYLPAMNGLAWVLATSITDSSRDGAEAVKWAERLCNEDGWKTTAYLDTLAAAYAEADRWDDAVATQKKAIAALTATDTTIKASVESRLQKYLNQEKARE